MDGVHSRRHENPLQPSFDLDRQLEVAVMEDHRQQQASLPRAQRLVVDAEENDLRRSKSGRERELSEMKTDAGAAVEIEIDVMDRVKPPQHRCAVIQPMPDVQRVIEEQESEHDAKRAWK